jgi:glutathione synthase/RimK-type ligase-like ATP-grasp enzyme
MSSDGAASRVGITCRPDHPVFSAVAERLAARGYDVAFFDPEETVDDEELAALSLFVSKQTRPASVRTLVAAERLGVPTWNSATGVLVCVSRFSQLCALAGVGFDVPRATTERPEGDYVAKNRYHWNMSPEVNGEGDVYEELLPADPVDYKYYVVDDGSTHRAAVLRATSKLWGPKRVLGTVDPVPRHVERIATLMDRLGMRGVGVDVLRVDDCWYAVDLNPCPSFGQTGLETALTDSIESCLDR